MADVRRIAALVPNVLNISPGQRVRIEHWARHLGEYDWMVDFYPFEDQRLNAVLYRKGHFAAKVVRLLACYVRQLRTVAKLKGYDVIFIYREAALIGPAILERLAARLGPPVVYDIDDPIFLSIPSVTSGFFSKLKFPRKTNAIVKMSDHVIAINDLLAGYARRYNDSVSIVPNFLDPDKFKPVPERRQSEVRIGWTGSQSTMANLHAIAGPLREIQRRFGTPVRVIGTGDLAIEDLDLDVRQWTPETEVADLQECQIGVLPVLDRPENEWKFFLKLVQYLTTGLAVVAQRSGSNADVIEDEVNGFIVDTPEQWVQRLSQLIEDTELRDRMGDAARRTAVERYSSQVQMPRVAAIFNQVLDGQTQSS